jgi:hypothetical protein
VCRLQKDGSNTVDYTIEVAELRLRVSSHCRYRNRIGRIDSEHWRTEFGGKWSESIFIAAGKGNAIAATGNTPAERTTDPSARAEDQE